jgi:hypothetical protein
MYAKIGAIPLLQKTLKELRASKLNFEAELRQFLPKSHWAIIRNFKESLVREIERFI